MANPELHKVLIEQVNRVGDLERLGEFEVYLAKLVCSYLEHHAAKIGPKDLPLASFIVAQSVVTLTHKAVAEQPEILGDGRMGAEITDLVLGYLASAHEKR